MHHPAKGRVGAWAEVSHGVATKFNQRDSLTKAVMVTAVEVVDALYAQGWRSFKIEEGSSHMKLACWSYLNTMKGVKVSGFKPTVENKAWHERVEEHWAEVKRGLDSIFVDVGAKLE